MRRASAATSLRSSARTLPPRGLRVKNAKVFAPMESAVSPMAANPFEIERWHPMVSMASPSFP